MSIFDRFRQNKVARGSSGFDLAPIMISSLKYREGLMLTKRGTPAQELAREEMDRMFLFYEVNHAWMQPLSVLNGTKKLWEVRFPVISRYKNGPKHEDVSEALIRNFHSNNLAPGFKVLAKGDGKSFLKPENLNLGEGKP